MSKTAIMLLLSVLPMWSPAVNSGSVVSWGAQVLPLWDYNSPVIAIAAGGSHDLALKADGSVVALGNDSSGQSTVPANLTDVTAIAAGHAHSLALLADGTVVAWGANYFGQSTVPSKLTDVIAIAAGVDHSLALTADGSVVAWGWNADGQSTVPANLTDVIAIAAGHAHSLALRADGTVVAWGANYFGQSTVPSKLTDVIAIAAGVDHSLALTADGSVVAWGANHSGESTVPANLTDVTSIAAGGNHEDSAHSLALKANGTVVAWGWNADGQSTVPANLSGVIAIAAGHNRSLALKADGSVVAWGYRNIPSNLTNVIGIAQGLALTADGTVMAWHQSGESTVPANLTDVTSIAAAYAHSLALLADGSVVAWGWNADGQSTVPTNLSDVIAVAAGRYHSLALKADGMVVGWGGNYSGQSAVPANLNDVTAIAAGPENSMALKADGTVLAWGANDYGQSTVPVNLTDVTAIAAGYGHSLALKADGTVVAWGYNNYGQSTVPANLTGVIAIAAGGHHSLALVRTQPSAPSQPRIVTQPQNQTSTAGQTATFNVTVTGTAPLAYQWRKNGLNLPGANGPRLSLNSVTAADSGCYSVVVRNSLGSVESRQACLAVLADGANGIRPEQISAPATSRPVGKDSLVVVTHGFRFVPADWVDIMTASISNHLALQGSLNWDVRAYHWLKDAWKPLDIKERATAVGSLYGKQLATQQWVHVHLIGHSVGAALIQAAATEIKSNRLSQATTVHTTFLDPFVGWDGSGRTVYGQNSDWSDNYFARDNNKVVSPSKTEGPLSNAHNVDVTSLDDQRDSNVVYCTSGSFSTPAVICGHQAVSSHSYPHEFYTNTVPPSIQVGAQGYGFPLSKEAGGWSNIDNYPRGNLPRVLGGSDSLEQNDIPITVGSILMLSNLPKTSSGSVNLFGNAFKLDAGSLPLISDANVKTANASTSEAVWLAVALQVTNRANFLQFDSEFASTDHAEGLLTIYWNTNQIGFVDSRVTPPGSQTHRFPLPATVTNGLYTLSFRLDSFNGTESSIVVTNVATGFAGVEQPIVLDISHGTNGAPLLKLSAAAGFNYLLETSTNLADWTPAALLVNTNGSVLFSDPAETSSSQRFYRAIFP